MVCALIPLYWTLYILEVCLESGVPGGEVGGAQQLTGVEWVVPDFGLFQPHNDILEFLTIVYIEPIDVAVLQSA